MSPKPSQQPSEKAMDKLYGFLARMELKYAKELAEQAKEAKQQGA